MTQLEAGSAAAAQEATRTSALEAQLHMAHRKASELERRMQERETEFERFEGQVGSARRQLAEARTRIAELVAERDAGREAAAAAERTAAERDEALEALQHEVKGLRTTVEALTSEGTALRDLLKDAEGRLEAADRVREVVEADLAAIQGRLGYRIGRRLRRPFGRGG
jgi:chromosome segregation ATPase